MLIFAQGLPLALLSPKQAASCQAQAAAENIGMADWLAAKLRQNGERFRPALPLEPTPEIALPFTAEEVRALHLDAIGQGESPDEWLKSLLLFDEA